MNKYGIITPGDNLKPMVWQPPATMKFARRSCWRTYGQEKPGMIDQ